MIAFDRYLEQSRKKPFAWGDHDCITFANKACAAQKGYGFADEFLGKYTTSKGALLTYQRWIRSTKYDSLINAVDDRLDRLKTNIPPIGSIVAKQDNLADAVLPIKFGVCVGRLIAFVGADKLVLRQPSSDMIFWKVRNEH